MLKNFLIIFMFIACLLFKQVLAQEFSFNQPLVDAADRGDEAAVINFLQQGYKVDSRGEFGVTALMRAAYHGNVRIIKILARAGADGDAIDYGGATALHLATRQGHLRVVKILLQMHADSDEPDDNGLTPLMKAVNTKNKNMVQLLLKHGANPLKKNKWGQNASHLAQQNKDPEITSFFGEDQQISSPPEPYQLFENSEIEVQGLPWINSKEIQGLPWLENHNNTPPVVSVKPSKTTPATKRKKPTKPPAATPSVTVAKAVRVPLSANFTTNTNLQMIKQPNLKLWIKSNYYDSEYEALLKYQEINNYFHPEKFKAKIVNIISDQEIRQYSLMLGPIPNRKRAELICQKLNTEKQSCSLVEDITQELRNN